MSAHEELAESVRDILDEMPHAQVLFEILLERTHKLETSKEVMELKNTLFSKIQLLQGRVQSVEKALDLHTKHFVYIFYNVITDEYRIGKADNVDRRQKQMHTVEQDIKRYMTIATRNAREALLLERYLQAYFHEKRTQGDWYKFDAEDLKMLALFALLHETV
ncbi:MAG: hypothetical protein EAZ95_07260 [Bacteroidetes bacterium]|nr:MAG: hypothetical protein EAZ95_07260 [Bacteroidota bacterium]